MLKSSGDLSSSSPFGFDDITRIVNSRKYSILARRNVKYAISRNIHLIELLFSFLMMKLIMFSIIINLAVHEKEKQEFIFAK